MATSEREQRLSYLGLTERDAELLRALRPVFEKHMDAVEEAFYRHLLVFPETAQLLKEPGLVARLKTLQRDYLLRITDGRFDDAYFEDRQRIGRTHERVGLSPRLYLLAYSLYFRLFAPLIADRDTLVALQKVFQLDASLAMDAYIASDRYRRLQQLESIVNDSADAIFMLDNDKHIRTWNRAAERILGWSDTEIFWPARQRHHPAGTIALGRTHQH